MTYTENVAQFVRDLRFEDLPEEVIGKAKMCLLDLLGVGLAGTTTRSAKIARSFMHENFGQGDATVFGESYRSTCAGAAWANSQAACALDMEDGHNWSAGHPASVIIPAALSVAEKNRASGKELIAGIVAGYEASIRIAGSRRPAYVRTYATGTWGAYGAALAAGKILHLSVESLVHAVGIAGSHGPARPHSKSYQFVPMLKECIGWAGFTGVSAALLARQGFTGFTDLLDYGEFFDCETLTGTLGREYEILQVYFKLYSACRWTHAAIEGVLNLKELYRIVPEEITRIIIWSFERASVMGYRSPKTSESAQYSIPWCVAMALIYGEVGPKQVADDCLGDPRLQEIADKVEICYDGDLQKLFPLQKSAIVEVQTKKGNFKFRVDGPAGDPGEKSLSFSQLAAKFLKLVSPLMGDLRAEELVERVSGIEKENSIQPLMELVKM